MILIFNSTVSREISVTNFTPASAITYTFICVIAHCQVLQGLYFGYSPWYRSCGDWIYIFFLIVPFYSGKTTPETDKAVKVSTTAVLKRDYNYRNIFNLVSP